VAGATPVPTRYLTTEALAGEGLLDFQSEVRPLIDKELAFAHYQQLFQVHPERTRWSWQQFEELLDRTLPTAPEFVAAVEQAVPAAEDRFILAEVDRPFAGVSFADRGELDRRLVRLVETDLLRRTDPEYSADLAVFNALLSIYSVLSVAITAGRLSDEDRVRHVETEWHGFFSFVASGPPPRRLEELLALHRAGIVRFAGPELEVALDNDRFVPRSPAVPGQVGARHDPADAVVGAGFNGLYVKKSSQEAVEGYRPIFDAFMDSPGARHKQLPFTTLEEFLGGGSVLVGSPEQVIDKFGRYQEAFGHELSGVALEVPGLPRTTIAPPSRHSSRR